MGRVYWIGKDAVSLDECIKVTCNTEPEWKSMQDFCGGYLEHVSVLFEGKQAHMFVHEEGRYTYPDRNPTATEIYFAAPRARGIDPEDKDDTRRETEEMAARMGMTPDQIVYVDPGDKPVGIYGPAVLLVDINAS